MTANLINFLVLGGNGMNKRVIKPLVVILLIGMFGYFAYGLVNQGKKTDVGDKAYNFSLPNLDGSTTKLSDLKGNMVIINYFATWCEPCKDEAPELEQFAKDYGSKYKLVMLNRGETKERVKTFLKKYNTPAIYLFDYNAKISKIYNVTGQPETFIIDRDGVIREHYNGPLTENHLYSFVKKYDK
jgi:cytochrome c biogenesis protein CcmG, thiol:disulfide interchange protein DsbE